MKSTELLLDWVACCTVHYVTWLVNESWKYLCHFGYVKLWSVEPHLGQQISDKTWIWSLKYYSSLCEVCCLSISEHGMDSFLQHCSLFWRTKTKYDQLVLCDGRSVTQKQMQNTQNEDLESVLFEWFYQERLAAIATDGPISKGRANHFMAGPGEYWDCFFFYAA
jgi:hypothetical protein